MPKRTIEEGKILIIDDEAGNVQIFERILRGAGFKNIVSITDSLKAVETYKKFRPDLVLLDLKMPNMDGFDVMAALKKVGSLNRSAHFDPDGPTRPGHPVKGTGIRGEGFYFQTV